MTLSVKINELQALRIKKGMSIRALSTAAGLSTATIFKIESAGNIPTPSTAKKICDALEVKFDDLFEITEKQ